MNISEHKKHVQNCGFHKIFQKACVYSSLVDTLVCCSNFCLCAVNGWNITCEDNVLLLNIQPICVGFVCETWLMPTKLVHLLVCIWAANRFKTIEEINVLMLDLKCICSEHSFKNWHAPNECYRNWDQASLKTVNLNMKTDISNKHVCTNYAGKMWALYTFTLR